MNQTNFFITNSNNFKPDTLIDKKIFKFNCWLGERISLWSKTKLSTSNGTPFFPLDHNGVHVCDILLPQEITAVSCKYDTMLHVIGMCEEISALSQNRTSN